MCRPTFNLPHVSLVDTDGKGLDAITATGIVANGQEYPVDVIVWSTGYGNPLTESLAGKAEMAVKGKDGQDMEALSKQMDLQTQHGILWCVHRASSGHLRSQGLSLTHGIPVLTKSLVATTIQTSSSQPWLKQASASIKSNA